MKLIHSFAAIIGAGLALAQPNQMPNRISPEQQAALDKAVELEKKKPQDLKECTEIAAKRPLKHLGNVIAEQAAARDGCMSGRGHYVP